MVRPATRAAAERRKASAPASGGFVQADRPWRAPRPQHSRMATSESVARPLTTRLPALRLLLCGGPFRAVPLQNSDANRIARRRIYFHLSPRAGRGRDCERKRSNRVRGRSRDSERCRLSASVPDNGQRSGSYGAPSSRPSPRAAGRRSRRCRANDRLFLSRERTGNEIATRVVAAEIAPAGTENSPQRARGRRRV